MQLLRLYAAAYIEYLNLTFPLLDVLSYETDWLKVSIDL